MCSLYYSSPPNHSLPDCLHSFSELSRDLIPDTSPILPLADSCLSDYPACCPAPTGLSALLSPAPDPPACPPPLLTSACLTIPPAVESLSVCLLTRSLLRVRPSALPLPTSACRLPSACRSCPQIKPCTYPAPVVCLCTWVLLNAPITLVERSGQRRKHNGHSEQKRLNPLENKACLITGFGSACLFWKCADNSKELKEEKPAALWPL